MVLGRRRSPPSMRLDLSRWSCGQVESMRRWSGYPLVRDTRRGEVYRCSCRGGVTPNTSPFHRVKPIVRRHHTRGSRQCGPPSIVRPVGHVCRREIGRARRVAVQRVSQEELIIRTFAPFALVSKPMSDTTDHVRKFPMASSARPSSPARCVSHHDERWRRPQAVMRSEDRGINRMVIISWK